MVSQSIRRKSGATGSWTGAGGGGGGGLPGVLAPALAGAPWGGRDLEFIIDSALTCVLSPDWTPETAHLYKSLCPFEQ